MTCFVLESVLPWNYHLNLIHLLWKWGGGLLHQMACLLLTSVSQLFYLLLFYWGFACLKKNEKVICKLSDKWCLSVGGCTAFVSHFDCLGIWALQGKKPGSRWGPAKGWWIHCSMWSTPVWTHRIMTARCVLISEGFLMLTYVSDLISWGLCNAVSHCDVFNSADGLSAPGHWCTIKFCPVMQS